MNEKYKNDLNFIMELNLQMHTANPKRIHRKIMNAFKMNWWNENDFIMSLSAEKIIKYSKI